MSAVETSELAPIMLYFVSIYEGGPRPVLFPHGAKVGTPGSVLILQHNAMKLIMMEDVGLNDVTFTQFQGTRNVLHLITRLNKFKSHI